MQNYKSPKYNKGENLEDLVLGDYFLDATPMYKQ